MRLGEYSLDLGFEDEIRTDLYDMWLFVDTMKVLERWGPGCHFFGFGNEQDIDRLEALLEEESRKNPGCPLIASLVTEFPTNPLVRAPNLRRLRALADKYEFLMVFSGYSDVMGGRSVDATGVIFTCVI